MKQNKQFSSEEKLAQDQLRYLWDNGTLRTYRDSR